MKSAILLSAPYKPGLMAKVQAGTHPVPDYIALADALNATLITPVGASESIRRSSSKIVRFAKCAWAAFRQRHNYDLIITDQERVGVILAMMMKVSGSSKRHIMICHGKIANPKDLRLVRALNLQSHIDRFICYGSLIAARLQDVLGLSSERVVHLMHGVDHRFWRPLPVTPERLIVSGGMLRRDYPTLVEAVRGIDVSVTIAASSPWVTSTKNGLSQSQLPPNVSLTRCDYQQMRDLYARGLFVAIPLHNSHTQSGSLVAYEAMAMGKAVVVTGTDGQEKLGVVRHGDNGYYAAPGHVAGWKEIILRMCADPRAAVEMGRRGRLAVEEHVNQEYFTRKFVDIAHALNTKESNVQEHHGTAPERVAK